MEINDEDGNTKQQIVNVNEASLYEKMTPSKTFIAREKSVPGLKSPRLTPF
jgi:hypothetical protein